tara:strand:+ start:899 stop:1510 length:612 start_codon:yes stop_codon:yes gene_type:complete
MGFFNLPNIPLFETALSEEIVNHLWGYVKEAKENCTHNLAGNIEKSLNLVDTNNYYFEQVLKPICIEYYSGLSDVTSLQSNHVNPKEFHLKEFWVNYMNKHEFNPVHCHGGVFSFVIWMQIPFDSREQYEMPIAKNSNCPSASDFSFLYTDVLGQVTSYKINLSQANNGIMMVFPSSMNHQVYPYYKEEEQRISISGNIFWKG